MTESDVLQAVLDEVAEAMNLPRGDLSAAHRLVADLGAESIDLVDLTFRFEKRFDLVIPQGELFESGAVPLEHMTLADVVRYLHARAAG